MKIVVHRKTGKLYPMFGKKNGRVQKAFKEKIGIPVGRCMANAIPKGSHPGSKAVQAAIQKCKVAKGTSLGL